MSKYLARASPPRAPTRDVAAARRNGGRVRWTRSSRASREKSAMRGRRASRGGRTHRVDLDVGPPLRVLLQRDAVLGHAREHLEAGVRLDGGAGGDGRLQRRRERGAHRERGGHRVWTKETGGGVCGNASCRASFERCEEQIRKISRRGANGATRLAEPVAAVIRPGTSGEMDSAFAFRTRFSLRFPQVAPVIRRQLSVAHLFLVFGFFTGLFRCLPRRARRRI